MGGVTSKDLDLEEEEMEEEGDEKVMEGEDGCGIEGKCPGDQEGNIREDVMNMEQEGGKVNVKKERKYEQ